MKEKQEEHMVSAVKEVVYKVSISNPMHICPIAYKNHQCDYGICNDCKPETTGKRGKDKKDKKSRAEKGVCVQHHPDDLMSCGDTASFTPQYYKKIKDRSGNWPFRCAGTCNRVFIKVVDTQNI